MLKLFYLSLGHQPGMTEGFKNAGLHVEVFDYFTYAQHHSSAQANQEFIKKSLYFQPDVIHCQLQMTNIISSNSILEVKRLLPNVIITNWSGDIRKKPSSEMVSMSNYVDFTLLSNVGQIEMYKSAGARNVHYWQIGIDPNVSKPLNKENFKYIVSFIGNSYDRQFPDSHIRSSVAKRLRDKYGHSFGLFGAGYSSSLLANSVDISSVNQIYNDSLCVLSISNFNDVSHYFSDRFLMCIASGRPCISYRFPGINNYFINGKEVLSAESQAHIEELIQYCIDNRGEAELIGKMGAVKAICEHTFTSRAMELIDLIGLRHKI